jgi:hypothetical protein
MLSYQDTYRTAEVVNGSNYVRDFASTRVPRLYLLPGTV